jgi:hypothetical protein
MVSLCGHARRSPRHGRKGAQGDWPAARGELPRWGWLPFRGGCAVAHPRVTAAGAADDHTVGCHAVLFFHALAAGRRSCRRNRLRRGVDASGVAGRPGGGHRGAGPSAAGTGAARVPAGFQPVSASFQSPARGFALGAVGCRQVRACQARLGATTDAGAHWRFTGAPDVRLFNPAGNTLVQASRVSDVLFASQRTGWLYGRGLWATHDGGATWRRISLGGDIVPSMGGGVVAMATAAGTAYAMVAPDPFHGNRPSCTPAQPGRTPGPGSPP